MTREEMEEVKRHFDVVAEGLRGEIRQVAEGVALVNEGLDRQIHENETAHREILSAIRFSYAELDQRIRSVETEVAELKSRLTRLEADRT